MSRTEEGPEIGSGWKIAIGTAFAVVLLLKGWSAFQLDLIADEAFYWQAAQRPALAYTDLPLVTAMLVKLGTLIAGDTTFGVRLPFLLMGTAFPLVVFALARPLVGERQAWWAAGVSLITPALGYLGTVTVPDVPLMLLSALFLLAFERATRLNQLRWWLLAGGFCALGFATHYRFVLAPFSGFLYMVLTREGRSLWRGKRWLPAGFVASLGLLPVLIYNAKQDFAPLRYFILVRNRQGFRFDELLEHVADQAALVTPLLYVALIGTLIMLFKRARGGDDRAALMVCFAAVPLFLYFLTSPLKGTGAQTMHWPAAGYLPLVVFLPGMLQRFRARKPTRGRSFMVAAGPALGTMVMLVLLIELASGSLRIPGVLKPFLGSSQAGAQVVDYLEQYDWGESPLVVADHYKLGSNLEFQMQDRARFYILQHSKNFEHGRQLQFDFWDMGEPALREHAGRDALVVVEWSECPSGTEARWQEHLEWLFDPLEPLGDWRYDAPGLGGDPRVFRFYRGTVIPKR